MEEMEFMLTDLKRILLAGAGADADLDGEILDMTFEELGYESLAVLETVGRIEREYVIVLDDGIVQQAPTPRALIDAVNARITTVSA